MMNWAVYWSDPENPENEIDFFETKEGAIHRIDELIEENESVWDVGYKPNWDITLLEIKGEVREIPYGDGSIKLYERTDK